MKPAAALPALWLASVALVLGCGRGEPPAPPATYTVRGEIVSLPGPGGREALIRHEAVPDLRDAAGKTVGMESMTMPFVLAPGVDRAQLAVGDRIEFTLEVRWHARDPVVVTRATKLPPSTRLEFDPPAQDAGDTSGAPARETSNPPAGSTPR